MDDYADVPAVLALVEEEDYSDMPALQEPALPTDDEEDYSNMPELLQQPTKWIHPYIFHRDRALFTPIDDLPPLISDSSEDDEAESTQSSDGYESSDASGDSGDYVGSGEE